MKFLIRSNSDEFLNLVVNLPFLPNVGDVLVVTDAEGCFTHKVKVTSITHNLSIGHGCNCIYDDSVLMVEPLGYPD